VLSEKNMYVAFGIKKYTLSIQVPDNARQGINSIEQSTKSMTRYFINRFKKGRLLLKI
jgi:translation elongation factor EF-1beta